MSHQRKDICQCVLGRREAGAVLQSSEGGGWSLMSCCCCCGQAPRRFNPVQHLQELCSPKFSYEVVDASGNVLCRSTDCKYNR